MMTLQRARAIAQTIGRRDRTTLKTSVVACRVVIRSGRRRRKWMYIDETWVEVRVSQMRWVW